MEISCEHREDKVYVSLVGEVENGSETELMKKMRALLKEDFEEAVFDLSRVPVITGPAIGKFLMFYRNASATGKRMRIKGMNDGIFGHFKNLRIHQLFPVEK